MSHRKKFKFKYQAQVQKQYLGLGFELELFFFRDVAQPDSVLRSGRRAVGSNPINLTLLFKSLCKSDVYEKYCICSPYVSQLFSKKKNDFPNNLLMPSYNMCGNTIFVCLVKRLKFIKQTTTSLKRICSEWRRLNRHL